MELAWYIPVLIFSARIVDVSLGTVRMLFTLSGWRWVAAGLGFLEVVVWAMAVGGLIHFITHPVALLSYASGFATGTLTGMMIEEKLAVGIRLVRVINPDLSKDVSSDLRSHGYRVTRVEGTGQQGPVEIAFVVVKRKSLAQLLEETERLAPEAFVTVERAESASSMALTGSLGFRQRMRLALNGVRK